MNLVRAVAFAVLFGGGLVASPAVAAESGPLDTLRENSPFLPLAETDPAGWPSGAGGALEFRGLIERDGELLAGIFDRATGRSFWVPVGELPGAAGEDDAAATLTASAYDAAGNRLRGSFQGRAFTLELARAFVGETPGGSASAEDGDVTEALAATLAADMEQEDAGDGYPGRRLVLARFGPPAKWAGHDEGNAMVFAGQGRNRSQPAVAPIAFAPVTAEIGFTGTTEEDFAQEEVAFDPWLGVETDTFFPDADDGGRRLLIRRRVGLTTTMRRTD